MKIEPQILKDKARAIRKTMLEMCITAGKGHVTSSMSCVDIFVTLYHGAVMQVRPEEPDWPGRDRLFLSKGQASPALYTVLADRGFFPRDDLKRFAKPGGRFAVHLQKDVPGVEATAGSLGQAYGLAAGVALAAKMDRELFTVYAVLGDGECYEGSIWETAMFAAHQRLNNLVTIIDRNYLCVTDFTENLVELEPFEKKWQSFGFNVQRIDGHSYRQLQDGLSHLKSRPFSRPSVIIADTVKGKGTERLCYDPLWHGAAPQGDIARECLLELEGEE